MQKHSKKLIDDSHKKNGQFVFIFLDNSCSSPASQALNLLLLPLPIWAANYAGLDTFRSANCD